MPILPDPGAIQRRTGQPSTSVLQPRAGIVEQATAQAAALEGRTAGAMSQGLQSLGSSVLNLAAQEKERLDTLQSIEYENKLVDIAAQRELESQKIKGNGVLQDDYIKKQLSSFDADADGLNSFLTNDVQKEKAKLIRDKLRSSFGRNVALHAARETEKLDESAYQGQLKSWANYGASNPTNVDQTRAGVEGVRTAVINRMVSLGRDPTEIEAVSRESVGGVHLQILDSLRVSGKIMYANSYLETNAGEMTPEQVEIAKSKLRDVTEQEQGIAIGTEAHDKFLGGATKLEIAKFLNEQQLSPGARSIAERAFNDLAKANEEDQQNTKGSLILTFLDSDMSQRALSGVLATDEYQALNPKERVSLREHLIQLQDHKDASKESSAAKIESEKANNPANYIKVYEYSSDPDKLARMSMGRIAALAPEIGITHTKRLMAERERIVSGARSAKLSPALVNAAISGLSTKDQKAAKGSIASAYMDWQTDHPGSVATEDQQAEIISQAQENWVKVGAFWNDEDKKKYEIPKGEGYPLFFKEAFPRLSDDDRIAKYEEFSALAEGIISNARAAGKTPPTRDRILEFFRKKQATTGNYTGPLPPD